MPWSGVRPSCGCGQSLEIESGTLEVTDQHHPSAVHQADDNRHQFILRVGELTHRGDEIEKRGVDGHGHFSLRATPCAWDANGTREGSCCFLKLFYAWETVVDARSHVSSLQIGFAQNPEDTG